MATITDNQNAKLVIERGFWRSDDVDKLILTGMKIPTDKIPVYYSQKSSKLWPPTIGSATVVLEDGVLKAELQDMQVIDYDGYPSIVFVIDTDKYYKTNQRIATKSTLMGLLISQDPNPDAEIKKLREQFG